LIAYAEAFYAELSRDQPRDIGPPPEETEDLWRIFGDLSNRRQSGMAPSPVQYSEIEAYCRMTGLELDAWELSVICRLDNAALRAFTRNGRQQAAPDPNASSQIPVENTKAMKDMFRGLATRKRKS